MLPALPAIPLLLIADFLGWPCGLQLRAPCSASCLKEALFTKLELSAKRLFVPPPAGVNPARALREFWNACGLAVLRKLRNVPRNASRNHAGIRVAVRYVFGEWLNLPPRVAAGTTAQWGEMPPEALWLQLAGKQEDWRQLIWEPNFGPRCQARCDRVGVRIVWEGFEVEISSQKTEVYRTEESPVEDSPAESSGSDSSD